MSRNQNLNAEIYSVSSLEVLSISGHQAYQMLSRQLLISWIDLEAKSQRRLYRRAVLANKKHSMYLYVLHQLLESFFIRCRPRLNFKKKKLKISVDWQTHLHFTGV